MNIIDICNIHKQCRPSQTQDLNIVNAFLKTKSLAFLVNITWLWTSKWTSKLLNISSIFIQEMHSKAAKVNSVAFYSNALAEFSPFDNFYSLLIPFSGLVARTNFKAQNHCVTYSVRYTNYLQQLSNQHQLEQRGNGSWIY